MNTPARFGQSGLDGVPAGNGGEARNLDEEAFLARMKGIPADVLARAMTSPGISFSGCSKSRMATAWSLRNAEKSGYECLKGATIEGLHAKAVAIRDDIARRALARTVSPQCANEHLLRLSVHRGIDRALPHLLFHQALDHLHVVLNGCRNSVEQLRADTAAREFLAACGR